MYRGHVSWSWSRSSATLLVAATLVAGCDGPTGPAEVLHLRALTATSLVGTVGQDVAPAPTVRVTSAAGLPVADVTVYFEAVGGGAVAHFSAQTDADGSATAGRWTLGTIARAHRVVAYAAGSKLTFSAMDQPGPAGSPRSSTMMTRAGTLVWVNVDPR